MTPLKLNGIACAMPPRAPLARVLVPMLLSALSACSSVRDQDVVSGPLRATAVPTPPQVERVATGSIYQAGMSAGSLYSGEPRPRHVGDTLKVQISENLSASNKVNTDASRASSLASKGPGAKAGLGVISSIMNIDATASGSSAFKGDGKSENSSSFTGQLAATVINVLPNGHLVVAGDRAITMNGGASVLRFSAIVNPRDIGPGNVVASSDTVNARIEVVGRGDVSDVSSRSWIQRVLANSLAFW